MVYIQGKTDDLKLVQQIQIVDAYNIYTALLHVPVSNMLQWPWTRLFIKYSFDTDLWTDWLKLRVENRVGLTNNRNTHPRWDIVTKRVVHDYCKLETWTTKSQ